MTIHVEALTFPTIIGILDSERITPQDVVVDASIDYCYKHSEFLNYAELIATIESQMIEKKYELLEEALIDITTLLLSKYPQIKNIHLKISKPDIITNAKVALSINIKH